MSFEIGRKKTGGRQKGTLNKDTYFLRDALFNLEFDPTKNLIDLLPKLTPDKQADILLKLSSMIYKDASQKATPPVIIEKPCSRCDSLNEILGKNDNTNSFFSSNETSIFK
jgi:hypothetical protein